MHSICTHVHCNRLWGVGRVMRVGFVLVCTALPHCSAAPEPQSEVPGPQGTTIATVPEPEPIARALPEGALPELQRQRLEYLFDAARLLARTWAFQDGQETCLMLLAPDMQWVVNCAEAPAAGFARLTSEFHGKPVFARRGGTFDAEGRDLSTAQLLERMPAAAHVDEPGARNSDLPARHPWLLLGSLEALMRYHPAFEQSSTEEWLSVAMHEYFHACQMRQSGFANTLHRINTHELDAKPLAALYTRDARYRGLVQREYAHLVAAARAPLTQPETRQALRAWRNLYRQRRAQLAAQTQGEKLIESDSLFTYLEGVARYVESTFLVEAGQHPSSTIAGDARFHRFAKWENLGYAAMPNRQLDPEYYYALGFHLGLLLDRIDPNWKRDVAAEAGWLLGVAQRNLDKPAQRVHAGQP
jgi:hypothetical protein